MAASTSRKVALIMGIANQKSIAWSCMEKFLQKDWYVIYTVQNEKIGSKVEAMLKRSSFPDGQQNSILGGYSCDVTDRASMDQFFHRSLPDALQQQSQPLSLHAVIHSLAFASNLKTPLLETTKHSFLEAHEISSYSLIEVARESLPFLRNQTCSDGENYTECSRSITTLSYLGATRAIPGYNVMGPAKASLESVVRGLAVDLRERSSYPIRVNAVRAGPLPTISSKGGITGFDLMRRDVENKSPLGNVTQRQVADSVYHVAAEAHGMTGQSINIDGGYSIVAGPSMGDLL
ncbi:enoyl-ACP reductase [Nitzschia inconspicua]|uniref:Enoyl-ACP reductase n=1 Tax=Nitzschia inconspicua TaxID=303405 RepID=A0A9K3L1J6_9STRA|nr:enoyl-ACP reductase [Nitzschia inconspicua]